MPTLAAVAPLLYAPDAQFLLDRLVAGATAGILAVAKIEHQWPVFHALTKAHEPQVAALGFVLVHPAELVASVRGLRGAKRASIDGRTWVEFADRERRNEGPFFYYPVTLIEKFDAPRIVGAATMRPGPYGFGPAVAIPGKADHRHAGESVSDCVSRKIPILIEEGMPRAQAVAVAHRLCGAPKPAEKAEWTTAYINDLPDSAFLLVESSGQKDATGKTVPRSLRHFPVRDAHGDLDLAHLRNALARIPVATAGGISDDKRRGLEAEARRLLATATHKMRVLKLDASAVSPNDERFVLGVVLEPEVEDSQRDIYSAEEVRLAAHYYLEHDGRVGKMHQELLTQGVKVLESYLAPTDFSINGETVRKGTWLMGMRVTDDALWAAIKSGAFTGFSIGGDAIKIPTI